MTFVEVATINEIPPNKMKHFEVGEKEIMVANVAGIFYAINDRCGHMNGRLSNGVLDKTVVTCPVHGAQFDVTTGKKISNPRGLKKILLQGTMGLIKTYDVEVFEVKIEGESIQVKI